MITPIKKFEIKPQNIVRTTSFFEKNDVTLSSLRSKDSAKSIIGLATLTVIATGISLYRKYRARLKQGKTYKITLPEVGIEFGKQFKGLKNVLLNGAKKIKNMAQPKI